jgi:hypothetical protein
LKKEIKSRVNHKRKKKLAATCRCGRTVYNLYKNINSRKQNDRPEEKFSE